jgi:hypothetical protein
MDKDEQYDSASCTGSETLMMNSLVGGPSVVTANEDQQFTWPSGYNNNKSTKGAKLYITSGDLVFGYNSGEDLRWILRSGPSGYLGQSNYFRT